MMITLRHYWAITTHCHWIHIVRCARWGEVAVRQRCALSISSLPLRLQTLYWWCCQRCCCHASYKNRCHTCRRRVYAPLISYMPPYQPTCRQSRAPDIYCHLYAIEMKAIETADIRQSWLLPPQRLIEMLIPPPPLALSAIPINTDILLTLIRHYCHYDIETAITAITPLSWYIRWWHIALIIDAADCLLMIFIIFIFIMLILRYIITILRRDESHWRYVIELRYAMICRHIRRLSCHRRCIEATLRHISIIHWYATIDRHYINSRQDYATRRHIDARLPSCWCHYWMTLIYLLLHLLLLLSFILHAITPLHIRYYY